MSQIKNSLTNLFQKHRLVFWYDEKQEFQEEFEALSLPDVEKIRVGGNAFAVQQRVVQEAPNQRFLLYFGHAHPAGSDNWLLYLELGHHLFHTDQAALWLQELELDYHYKDVIEQHFEFFRNKERRAAFKALLAPDDAHTALRYKMLAVLFGVEYVNLEAFLLQHAAAFAENKTQYDQDLARFNLAGFYWGEVARRYQYRSEQPGIFDFLLELFARNFSRTQGKSRLSGDSRILLSQWKDARSYQEAFRLVSDRVAGGLAVEQLLQDTPEDSLLDDDLFQLVDRRILSELASQVADEQISPDRLEQFIKKRENKYWYADFEHLYSALSCAASMISGVRRGAQTVFSSFESGLRQYAETLYAPDYFYRQFVWHYRQSGQNSVLAGLADKVLKVYSSDWLPEINQRWQTVIDGLQRYPMESTLAQRNFFSLQVKPFVERGQRLFVVISDAMRYEIGQELYEAVLAEKRFDGELEFMFAGLPSYTQLGMAALLPHREIGLQPGSDAVLVNGMSSQGTPARTKILQTFSGVRAMAINAEEFMAMNPKPEGRDFVKQYDLIYIYHNRIDKVGDDKVSEEKVFEAAKEEIAFLQELFKRIANNNGSNIYVTADHGFLYQHQAVEDSDFSTASFEGTVWKESRRFVIGQNLKGDAGTRHFSGSAVGLSGEAELLLPKSVSRLRIKGAGSRYVHGGASLQEIVVPLLKISIIRQGSVKKVEIDIIKSSDRITTSILPVSFIQTELMGDKTLPREIRAAIYAEDGTALSDLFQYIFDIPEGSERQREVRHRFQISSVAGTKYKNQRVKLLLEEPVEGSGKWKEYKAFFYTLNISFTSDFDDF